jgi:hypothetical protein
LARGNNNDDGKGRKGEQEVDISAFLKCGLNGLEMEIIFLNCHANILKKRFYSVGEGVPLLVSF